MEKLTRTVGNICLFLGFTAAFCTILFLIKPVPVCIIVALFCGLMGFIASSVYIVMNTRFAVNDKKIHPGILGLLMSSVPVIFILILNAMHK